MSYNGSVSGPLMVRADSVGLRAGAGPVRAVSESPGVPVDFADAVPAARDSDLVARGRADSPGAPALIAVAHGSRDPRSAATMAAVVSGVAHRNPGLDVRLAFLDLSTPSVEQVIDAVAAQGHRDVIVVPLLLGSAFHARVDLPGLLAAARSRHPRLRLVQADVLGPDPLLITALRERVLATDADRTDDTLGVAVAAVGSSSAEANRRTRALGRLLTADTAWRAEVCFATTEPSLPQAISTLRAQGCTRVVVAPWFLAPGLLTDRLGAAAPHVIHADPLGSHGLVAEVVTRRYATAVREIRARRDTDIAVA
ncbi:sirohydrochlorin chelatase [Nocardia miyunensis]|uniref:sirohydrochlorin chelatase n=1 Tax=Nocardia miyunensis TaxID=282684 RepID=UPI000A86C3A4|nr:sirohydrochlorin chelatase [Nocardia miyunensis]